MAAFDLRPSSRLAAKDEEKKCFLHCSQILQLAALRQSDAQLKIDICCFVLLVAIQSTPPGLVGIVFYIVKTGKSDKTFIFSCKTVLKAVCQDKVLFQTQINGSIQI